MPHIHTGSDGQVTVVHSDCWEWKPHTVTTFLVHCCANKPSFALLHTLSHCLCKVVPLTLLLGKQLLQDCALAGG